MMFRYVCVAVLPALSRSFAGPLAQTSVKALVTSSTWLQASVRSNSSSDNKDAEKALEKEMLKSWVEMEKKGKQLEENPLGENALQLAEEVLEMALAYTHTKELVEESHFHEAHEQLEKVIDTERTLERAEREALRDIAEAELYLQEHPESQTANDDPDQRRRQAVVADISHRVENYVESRLAEAQQAEKKARQAEQEVKKHLEELQRRETDLKATLDELKRFKLHEETQM